MKSVQIDSVHITAGTLDITPGYPVSLLGYFNDRRSEGVLDRLYCRLIGLEKKSTRILLVQIDTCLIPALDIHILKENIARASSFPFENIMVTASHTHTAPALADFFLYEKEKQYKNELFEKIVDGVHSLPRPRPCTMRYGQTNTSGLSFNRRWVRDDGTVMTNPPKQYPRRIRPEGPVDPEVRVVYFDTGPAGRPVLIVNISNHVDTLGGRLISADWPGYTERYVQKILGRDIVLVPLIAPAGNINHFDFDRPGRQTGSEETQRIGESYARSVIKALKGSRIVRADRIITATRTLPIHSRNVSSEELKKAEELVSRFDFFSSQRLHPTSGEITHRSHSGTGPETDLTAENLAIDSNALAGLFARELLLYAESRPPTYDVPLQVFSIGPLRLPAIPGEPFVEMGIGLKRANPASILIPVSLANGYFGYIPPRACFERGGYETRTTRYNCLSEDAFDLIFDTLQEI